MRRLATIQRITNITPIPGADNIVRADVLGWSCVVGKDEFKVGDLAVYLEIDSWLDSSNPAFDTPVFQPRFTNWGTKRGMRLRTIKLRKQISQGLLMPLISFPELGNPLSWEEGADVTEILKIEKWSPPEEESSNGPNKTAGAKMFPSFIRKTDQERVQNYVYVLPDSDYLDTTFEVSIKLDGSSMTVFHVDKSSPHFAHCMEDMEKRAMKRMTRWQRVWHKVKGWLGQNKQPDYIVGVCSRNIELPLDGDSHFAAYVREHGLADKLRAYCKGEGYGNSIALQGELIAPSIQQNHEKVNGFQFHIFDVFDIDSQTYQRPEITRMVAKSLEVPTVPVLHESFSLRSLISGNPEETPRDLVEAILIMAEGDGMNKGVKREGLVFKDNLSEFSFKAISNSYLLKKEGK